MKKFSRLFFIALYLILCFSCSLDQEKPESGTQETISIVVPKSFGPSTNSRGLVDMTTNKPFDNFACATAVMSLVPAVANLEIRNDAVVGENNDFLINEKINFYGFTIVPQVKGSIVNQDGIYIRYDLPAEYDDNQVVGTIEYYYSTVKKTFSYREMVFLTFPLKQNPSISDWKKFIILIEYKDVPVTLENDGSISFKAGMPDENGELEKNLHFDAIHFSPMGQDTTDNFAISRYWGSINKTKDLYLAFGANFTGELTTSPNIPEELNSIIKDKQYNDLAMDEVYKIISKIYKNGEELQKHDLIYPDSYSGPYSSLEDFNKSLLLQFDESYNFSPSIFVGMGPTCFNIQTQENITLIDHSGNSNSVNFSAIEEQKENVIGKFKRLLEVKEFTTDSMGKVITRDFSEIFLEKMGITEEVAKNNLLEKILASDPSSIIPFDSV